MSRAIWFQAVPCLAGIGWHALQLQRGSLVPVRVVVCTLALAALVHGIRRRAEASETRGRDAFFAVVAAGAFWSAALEALLERGEVTAFGLTGLMAGALCQVLLTWPGHGLAPGKLAGHIAIGLTLFGGVRYALARVLPESSYEPVADAGSPEHSLFRGDDGRVRGTPGFRGAYDHPEFAGIRLEVNELGLRDGLDEVTGPRPGELSILILGDSLVWGIGVPLDLTFQELLEARAPEFSAQPVRVYCAGIPGYGPAQSRAMLAELAPIVRPDVVVLSMFEDNDPQESLYAARVANESTPESASGPAPDAARASALVRLLERASKPSFWQPLATAHRKGVEPLLVRAGLRNPRARANLFVAQSLRTPPPAVVIEALDAALRDVATLREECEMLGAELLVMLAPAALQAEEERFQAFVGLEPPAPGVSFSRDAFHHAFAAELRAQGTHVVDTLPALEARTAARETSYHDEGHWNAGGHAAALEVLVPALAEVIEAR